MSYHFNPATGKSGVCHATGKRGCPLTKQYADGNAPHFESKQEADAFGQKVIEAQQKVAGNTTEGTTVKKKTPTTAKKKVQYSDGNDEYREKLKKYDSDGVGPVLDIAGTEDWVLVDDCDTDNDPYMWKYEMVYYSPNKRRYFYTEASGCSCDSPNESITSVGDFYTSTDIADIRKYSGHRDVGSDFDPKKVPPLNPKLISPEGSDSSSNYFYNKKKKEEEKAQKDATQDKAKPAPKPAPKKNPLTAKETPNTKYERDLAAKKAGLGKPGPTPSDPYRDKLTDAEKGPVYGIPGTEDWVRVADNYHSKDYLWHNKEVFYSPNQRRYFWVSEDGDSRNEPGELVRLSSFKSSTNKQDILKDSEMKSAAGFKEKIASFRSADVPKATVVDTSAKHPDER